jgi:hypothetical protein
MDVNERVEAYRQSELGQDIERLVETHAAQATEGDPRSKELIWDGLVTLILQRLAAEAQAIGTNLVVWDVIPALEAALDVLKLHHPGFAWLDTLKTYLDALKAKIGGQV